MSAISRSKRPIGESQELQLLKAGSLAADMLIGGDCPGSLFATRLPGSPVRAWSELPQRR